MATIIWTSRALKDLSSTGEYIETDSQTAEKKIIKEVISKAKGFAAHPLKERPIPENIP